MKATGDSPVAFKRRSVPPRLIYSLGDNMTLDDAKSYLTNAISYWEIRRIIYNGVLAVIVLGYFVANLPVSLERITPDLIFGLFILAVLANIAYCAAYLADIVAQMSGFRDLWLRLRWIVFLIGMAFASILTRWFTMVFFSNVS
jgi:hypothetical protein